MFNIFNSSQEDQLYLLDSESWAENTARLTNTVSWFSVHQIFLFFVTGGTFASSLLPTNKGHNKLKPNIYIYMTSICNLCMIWPYLLCLSNTSTVFQQYLNSFNTSRVLHKVPRLGYREAIFEEILSVSDCVSLCPMPFWLGLMNSIYVTPINASYAGA